MLRGFRWQLLVLVMALILFGLAVASRLNVPPPVTPTPTAEVVISASATPAPSDTPAVIVPVSLPPSTETIPTFRGAAVGNVQRLNPLFADLNPVDQDITSLIYEGLSRINEHGEAVPGLAERWLISSDGLEYVVILRDDVLWQDGIAFNASDVIYTFSLLQSPDFPGNPELSGFWRTVEIQQLDPHIVRFRLTQPLGRFLDLLSIGLLPEHALRGTGAAQLASHPFNLSPIGTGPYQLEALRTTDGSTITAVDLRVAPVYRQRPEGQQGYPIDRLSFRLYDTFESALAALQSGDVDGLAARTRAERAALLNTINVDIHTAIAPELGVLIFNWANESTAFFRELRVRQGLQLGLERSGIITRQLQQNAVLATSPLPPDSWAYAPDLFWPQPDIATARNLLQTANLRRVGPGTPQPPTPESGILFSFSILTVDDPALVGIANEIAAQWSQLNITVTVEAVDRLTYQGRLDRGEFGAALIELSLAGSADPDVYQFWDADQYPDGVNFGGVDDRRIGESLERARRDANGINRVIHYRDFQQAFIERAIAIPLYYGLYTYATSPQFQDIQLGFVSGPSSRFAGIQYWMEKTG